ncbi:hypothetical protein KSF78_0006289 [Schistosoma japonicum]|nr:hypothetical protein KSF78_0006289 [Schistosoma japonicum]
MLWIFGSSNLCLFKMEV